jgi:hypothetical protein
MSPTAEILSYVAIRGSARAHPHPLGAAPAEAYFLRLAALFIADRGNRIQVKSRNRRSA